MLEHILNRTANLFSDAMTFPFEIVGPLNYDTCKYDMKQACERLYSYYFKDDEVFNLCAVFFRIYVPDGEENSFSYRSIWKYGYIGGYPEVSLILNVYFNAGKSEFELNRIETSVEVETSKDRHQLNDVLISFPSAYSYEYIISSNCDDPDEFYGY